MSSEDLNDRLSRIELAITAMAREFYSDSQERDDHGRFGSGGGGGGGGGEDKASSARNESGAARSDHVQSMIKAGASDEAIKAQGAADREAAMEKIHSVMENKDDPERLAKVDALHKTEAGPALNQMHEGKDFPDRQQERDAAAKAQDEFSKLLKDPSVDGYHETRVRQEQTSDKAKAEPDNKQAQADAKAWKGLRDDIEYNEGGPGRVTPFPGESDQDWKIRTGRADY